MNNDDVSELHSGTSLVLAPEFSLQLLIRSNLLRWRRGRAVLERLEAAQNLVPLR